MAKRPSSPFFALFRIFGPKGRFSPFQRLLRAILPRRGCCRAQCHAPCRAQLRIGAGIYPIVIFNREYSIRPTPPPFKPPDSPLAAPQYSERTSTPPIHRKRATGHNRPQHAKDSPMPPHAEAHKQATSAQTIARSGHAMHRESCRNPGGKHAGLAARIADSPRRAAPMPRRWCAAARAEVCVHGARPRPRHAGGAATQRALPALRFPKAPPRPRGLLRLAARGRAGMRAPRIGQLPARAPRLSAAPLPFPRGIHTGYGLFAPARSSHGACFSHVVHAGWHTSAAFQGRASSHVSGPPTSPR